MQLLASVAGALVAVYLFLVRPAARAARVRDDLGAAVPVVSYLGGATWWSPGSLPGTASWPLVRCLILPEGVSFRPIAGFLRWVVPRIDLSWVDIQVIERRRTGFLVRRADLPGAHVQFGPGRDMILAVLAQFPVRII